ncbi:phosphonate metabolism protein/1,5-bisphosphokinase (PRPP-forming) PhnN [Aurantimonas sp. C2-6-R+9]|uniref:phosphonate metabolism protein/1,5-bisphosphokinase (PRPP-forming) PhnN n=1 Tax=unclassified Aurantimonas TaxID=2638230 RepID=UPI002E16DD94|nr:MULTISPECIES: phosphonate metabolism protein/1,5-bisphosphokinase (PRPP-forming) PhnN [unclassified Aurantimonas]MEC5292297.1 phosphonate metabolism protein/1,5-bisphosphokinase (PRPP-forming) PhnN [Aurantimonas sp. C2-3-R2]MEC5382511.1 phosphonate metabolism protein/1,5-bisphosphokinase (PRPP-forming) PhnN [Aurantimonas sp. C2-6-R+9]
MSPEIEPHARDGGNRLGSGSPGSFVAVVGPSGAGKDSLLAIAAATLAPDTGFFFPRRVITRIALADAEDHDSLTPAAFSMAEAEGAFCLTWTAHRLSYGLPTEISRRLEAGETVVANVSRAALRNAAERFSRLHIIEITAPRHLLVERIAARGRETPEEIDLRLRRQATLDVPESAEAVHRIHNDRAIDDAAAAFLAILRRMRRSLPHPMEG